MIENDNDKKLEKEFERNREKFKLLYDLASQEYKDELDRAKTIDTKTNSVFTVLNVMLTLLIALTANQQFIILYNSLCSVIQIAIVISIVFIFIFLLMAWSVLFDLIGRNKIIKKINLESNNEFENTTYNDSEDINHFYFLIYKTYQASIKENSSLTNINFNLLKLAFNYIRIAFVLICIDTIMLYFSFLNNGVIK